MIAYCHTALTHHACAVARVIFLVPQGAQHSSRLVKVVVAQHNTILQQLNYKKS